MKNNVSVYIDGMKKQIELFTNIIMCVGILCPTITLCFFSSKDMALDTARLVMGVGICILSLLLLVVLSFQFAREKLALRRLICEIMDEKEKGENVAAWLHELEKKALRKLLFSVVGLYLLVALPLASFAHLVWALNEKQNLALVSLTFFVLLIILKACLKRQVSATWQREYEKSFGAME